MIYQGISAGLAELDSFRISARNFVQNLTFEDVGSFVACISIFESMNAIYDEGTKGLGESTWTPINYAQAAFCLTAGAVHLYLTRKGAHDYKRFNEKYLNNEDKLPSDKKEVILYVRSTNDRGFSSFATQQLSTLDKINSIYPVVLKQMDCIEDLETAAETLIGQGKIIKGLIIHAHGSSSSINIGSNNQVSTAEDFPNIIEKFFLNDTEYKASETRFHKSRETNDEKLKKALSLLDKDAQIILFSCSTGQGTSSIAEHVSKLANGREVTAPQTTIMAPSLKVVAETTSPTPRLSASFTRPWELTLPAMFPMCIALFGKPQILTNALTHAVPYSIGFLAVRISVICEQYFPFCADVTKKIEAKS